MTNIEKINKIFRETFMVPPDETLDDKDVINLQTWNSLEHYSFILKLEKEFSIRIDESDFISMTSYKNILKVINKYIEL